MLSSFDKERARKAEVLEALRRRQAGEPSLRSPEILVPASSSPAREPQPLTRNPNDPHFFRAPPPGYAVRQNPNTGIDPPAKRLKVSRDPSEASSVASPSGTPSPPSRPTSAVPLSRTGSSELMRSNLSNLNVNSHPSSPAASYSDLSTPLTKLKKRYDPDESPMLKPAGRSPLVAAASSSSMSAVPAFISENAHQLHRIYRRVPVRVIQGILDKHKENQREAVEEIRQFQQLADMGKPPPPSSYPPITSQAPAPSPVKQKPAVTSTIYANRGVRKQKRVIKDPDDESDASGGAYSDEESDGGWSGDDRPKRKRRTFDAEGDEVDVEADALKVFNKAELETFTGSMACSAEQASIIIQLRPFHSADHIRSKLQKFKGVSPKLFDDYINIMEGYGQIDKCLVQCESVANEVAATLALWRGTDATSDDAMVDVESLQARLRTESDREKREVLASYITQQPKTLKEGTVLKDYQMLGLNWLKMHWSSGTSCILADEMGLGKTIQVISFLAHLKEQGISGPHLIFVPASTLENWTREFAKFAPDIDVQTYYGSQKERAELRQDLKERYADGDLEVVLASYTQVQAPDDLKFFRKRIQFETCVYDEAHQLKNFQSKRYTDLVSIEPKWRLLLTGTPLQNNLQELVSLLMFTLTEIFKPAEQALRNIFKVHAQGSANLLSQQRVSRARAMLTPFVLRRRKANVLSLPAKLERVERCEMTDLQSEIYRDAMARSRMVVSTLSDDAINDDDALDEADGVKPKAKRGKKAEEKTKMASSGSHILMDLRKAASHPLLFRTHYTRPKIEKLARQMMKMPEWCDSTFSYLVEDLEVLPDYQIHNICEAHNRLRTSCLDAELFLASGKVNVLRQLIEKCQKEGTRMLLFSQFTMILDILQTALNHLNIKWVRLDGATKTDERQSIVDEFTDDKDITVFLLSTKAGGVGINLVAASVVVIFDQDFNPHNDKQAADRAYRIGQEREVEVIKLITRDSIDDDMFKIGETKLLLDDAVGGEIVAEGEEGKPDKTANEVKKSLLKTLRNKFATEEDGKVQTTSAVKGEDATEAEGSEVKEPIKVEEAVKSVADEAPMDVDGSSTKA